MNLAIVMMAILVPTFICVVLMEIYDLFISRKEKKDGHNSK